MSEIENLDAAPVTAVVEEAKADAKLLRHVFVVGAKGAGKTLLARRVAAALGRPCVDVSEELVTLLARILAAEYGRNWTVADAVRDIEVNKERQRAALREVGNIVTALDGSYLIRKALQTANTHFAVLAGVRRRLEAVNYYFHCTPGDDMDFEIMRMREEAEKLGDVWVFVKRDAKEPADDAFDARYFGRVCTVTVLNDGTEPGMQAAVKQVVRAIRTR